MYPCFLINFCYCREILYESDELPKEARDVAALLASKVYYHLGEYDEALSFSLGAGPAFEAETRVPGSEEFIETIVCTCNPLSVSVQLKMLPQPKLSTVTSSYQRYTKRVILD